MKVFGWYLLLLLAMLVACKSAPSTEEAPLEELSAVEESAGDSNSLTVTQEMYDSTLAEVKHFVENLNSFIRNKNFEGWKNALSDDLLARISSPEFLAQTSESNLLRSRKVVLKTVNDYFLEVVVPARSNSRVDEIEFTATDRVKVFYKEERVKKGENNTTSTEIRRLRLYELVKKSDTWKIID
jgi:hypothetical protein